MIPQNWSVAKTQKSLTPTGATVQIEITPREASANEENKENRNTANRSRLPQTARASTQVSAGKKDFVQQSAQTVKRSQPQS